MPTKSDLANFGESLASFFGALKNYNANKDALEKKKAQATSAQDVFTNWMNKNPTPDETSMSSLIPFLSPDNQYSDETMNKAKVITELAMASAKKKKAEKDEKKYGEYSKNVGSSVNNYVKSLQDQPAMNLSIPTFGSSAPGFNIPLQIPEYKGKDFDMAKALAVLPPPYNPSTESLYDKRFGDLTTIGKDISNEKKLKITQEQADKGNYEVFNDPKKGVILIDKKTGKLKIPEFDVSGLTKVGTPNKYNRGGGSGGGSGSGDGGPIKIKLSNSKIQSYHDEYNKSKLKSKFYDDLSQSIDAGASPLSVASEGLDPNDLIFMQSMDTDSKKAAYAKNKLSKKAQFERDNLDYVSKILKEQKALRDDENNGAHGGVIKGGQSAVKNNASYKTSTSGAPDFSKPMTKDEIKSKYK